MKQIVPRYINLQTRRFLWISEMQVTEEFSDKRKTLVVQSGAEIGT